MLVSRSSPPLGLRLSSIFVVSGLSLSPVLLLPPAYVPRSIAAFLAPFFRCLPVGLPLPPLVSSFTSPPLFACILGSVAHQLLACAGR